MSGTKSGFSLIELMVVILLIGLVATFLVPSFQNLSPQFSRNEFVDKFNKLLAFAWQNGLMTQRAHRLWFDMRKRIMRIEIESAQQTKDIVFEPIKSSYVDTSYTWPAHLQIKQFYIEGEEKLQKANFRVDTLWFYIAPDGLSQDAIINVIDTHDLDAQGKPVELGLVVNPFTVQLSRYDTFQKP